MKIENRENLETRQVRLRLRIEAEEWHKALDDCCEQMNKLYPAESRATRAELEAKYGEDFLYQDAVDATFPVALVEAINAENIQIAGAPELSVVEIGPDGYVFDALITLYPDVKLGQYKFLSAACPAAELTNDDSEAAIAEYLRVHTTQEHPDRAAMGDEVSIDFEGFVDGTPFEGGKAEQYPLVLGGGMFIPGFEEQLAGMTVGEERDVNVTFPEQYTPELAGKDALFKVTCRGITRHVMAELTDDYAKAQGFDDAADLRRTVMQQRLQQKLVESENAFAEALIAQVIDSMEVDLPAAMVESQLDGLMQELSQHMMAQGADLQQYLDAAGLTMEQLREQARSQADYAARYELAMCEIAKLEHIEVTEKDLETKYAEMAAMYSMTADQLKAQLPPMRLSHDLKLARARSIVVETGKKL